MKVDSSQDLKRIKDNDLFVVILSLVGLLGSLITIYSFIKSAQARFTAITLQGIYEAGCFILGLVLALAALKYSGGNARLTRALQCRVMMVVALMFYSYRHQKTWVVVAMYSLYVLVLVFTCDKPRYHTTRGRVIRNFWDLLLPAIGYWLDDFVISPISLMLILPLTVAGKYLWVRNAWLSITLPLIAFMALALSKIVAFSSLPIPPTDVSQAWWSFAILFSSLLAILVIVRFERRVPSSLLKRFTALIEEIGSHKMTEVNACSFAAGLVLADKCSILRKGDADWTENMPGSLAPATNPGGRSLAVMIDDDTYVVFIGKDLDKSDDLFFSKEEQQFGLVVGRWLASTYRPTHSSAHHDQTAQDNL